MDKLFGNLNVVLGLGLVLALALMGIFHADTLTAAVVIRWLHVFFGILWIGLLYYFNFVQIPTMPTIPAELKPGVTKYIAPNVLFYFRWSAALTVLMGLILAWLNGYVAEALSFRPGFQLIGTGMWIGLIMAANVWFIIWPNQQRALNIANAFPDLPAAEKAKAARTAGLFSRTNTMLSIPMLFCMVAAPHLA